MAWTVESYTVLSISELLENVEQLSVNIRTSTGSSLCDRNAIKTGFESRRHFTLCNYQCYATSYQAIVGLVSSPDPLRHTPSENWRGKNY